MGGHKISLLFPEARELFDSSSSLVIETGLKVRAIL